LAMLRQTGCDGVMIARGAIGNPFIFEAILKMVSGSQVHNENLVYQGTSAPQTLQEREPNNQAYTVDGATLAATMRQHLQLAAHYFGEKTACIEFRKHFCAYTKGLAGGAELRARAVQCTSVQEYEVLFKAIAQPCASMHRSLSGP